MDTHTSPVYLPTKFHVNLPKYKGVRASCSCSSLRVKCIFGNMAKYIASRDLTIVIESPKTIMYLHTKFLVNQTIRPVGIVVDPKIC